jgi:glycosyltransferase involved in cell wall biosynthesis
MQENITQSHDQKPFFSILIPTRDRSNLLGDLIFSILDQNFSNYELIIADNSEKEETQNILNQINDKRVINLRTGGLKMADNWETGIQACSGTYLLLFSDKMVLKPGSLGYLYQYINQHSPSCVQWDLDAFFDEELKYFKNKQPVDESILDSKSIIQDVLSSEFDSVKIPCHCNSAISMSLINSIKLKTGRACMQLNPDYTLAYQVLLNVDSVHELGCSLSILRYPSFAGGYGNGTSYMKKGDQAKQFMLDNSDWIDRTDKYQDVRIPSNYFGLDIILKDFYLILEKYNLNPNDFMNQNQRFINYYLFTYLEIILRINMGINMNPELKIWKSYLSNEEVMIKKSVNREIRRFKSKLYYVRLKKALIGNKLSTTILRGLGDKLLRADGESFDTIQDCLDFHKVM